MFGVVAIVLSLFVGGIPVLPAVFIFGSAGLLIGELYRRNLSGFSVLLGAGLIYTFNMLLVFLGFVLLIGENPMQLAIQITKEQLDMTESTLAPIGFPGQSIEQLYEVLDHLIYLAPLVIVGVGIILALFSLLVSQAVLPRLGHDVRSLPPFRDWQFPKSFLWYYLIVLLLAMIDLEEGTMLFVAVWNLFPLLEIVLSIQEFAFIFYYAHYKNVNKTLPIMIMIVVFVIAPLLHIVRILGIIDLGFNLRKRITSKGNRS